MKKTFTLVVILSGLTALLNAQVSDNYMLIPNDLTFNKNGEYDILLTESQSFTDEIGNPQLPIKIVSYVIPYNSTATGIQINALTEQRLSGNYYVYPAQPPIPLNDKPAPTFVEPNPEIYNYNLPYPNKTVEIINDGYTHGYHVVTVAIYPVVYYPADREIYLRNISFTINYNGVFDTKFGIPFERQSQRGYELGKQFVQSMVKNVSDVDNCRNFNAQMVSNSNSQNRQNDSVQLRGGSTSAIDVFVPDYIIITNNALKSTFQQLADWKTKKGVPAIIKTNFIYICNV
jgi:hypothetical protein